VVEKDQPKRQTAKQVEPKVALARGRRRNGLHFARRRGLSQTCRNCFQGSRCFGLGLPERSSPENGYFFWAYTIAITNAGTQTVQLRTRHWRITDALGRLQEVKGAGVVGEEPILKAGQSFEYTSGVPLQTPSGFMTGSYGMQTDDGERFDVEIPTFSLDCSYGAKTIN
jgi:ApaG protein